MDFISQLPDSNGFDSICTLVDLLTKQAHLVPCKSTITAEETAQIVVDYVVRHHGVPEKIISDRGPQFASAFWSSFWGYLGTKPALSTAFHPQTDGATERVNGMVETYIRHFTNYNQDNWLALLVPAEISYNGSPRESTGQSPYWHLYGQNPRFDALTDGKVVGIAPAGVNAAEAFEARMAETRAHLEKARQAMKKKEDRNRREVDVKVGDMVWLSTRNVTTTRPSKKLDYRKMGPFKVIGQVNPVTFKLDLPAHMRIHPVFHASHLSPHHENTIPGRTVDPPPPVELASGTEWEVEEILNVKRVGKGWKWLVRWKGYGTGDDTWQTEDELGNAKESLTEFYARNPTKPGPGHLRASNGGGEQRKRGGKRGKRAK
jgi:hypothetical protein